MEIPSGSFQAGLLFLACRRLFAQNIYKSVTEREKEKERERECVCDIWLTTASFVQNSWWGRAGGRRAVSKPRPPLSSPSRENKSRFVQFTKRSRQSDFFKILVYD